MSIKFDELNKEEQQRLIKEVVEWAEVRNEIMDADYEAYYEDPEWFNKFYKRFEEDEQNRTMQKLWKKI